MPTSYTSLLGLALPVTGELSGTWGDVVNNYITSYVDAAVAGAQTISGSQTAVTLSTTNGGSLSQAGSGSAGSAQYAIINCTGNPASMLTVTAPAASKAYLVINATSTNQSVKVVGVGPTTGVTVAASQAALIAWNGSDFRCIATTDISQLSGVLGIANGGTGQTTYTDGQLLIGNSSGNTLTKATLTQGTGITITNGNGSITIANSGGTVTSVGMTVPTFLSVSPSSITTSGTFAITFSGTALPVANGGTGLTSGTSGGVLYYSASGTLASSGVLAANAIVLGGGAGATPATTTTGTGVVTAIGNNVNTTGGLVTQSGTLASSALLLGGGSGSAITSTTTGSGVVTAIGNAVDAASGLTTTTGTATLTNKRVNPRAVAAGATSGNLTPNGDTTDVFNAFGLTGAITMLTPSGTPVDGQRLMLRFEDNGTGRGITWTTTSGAYRAVGVTLPSTTTASKITYVGCVYNSTDIFWDVVAVVTQA